MVDCGLDRHGTGPVSDIFCGLQHGGEESGFERFLGNDASRVAGLEELGGRGFGLGFSGMIDDDPQEGGRQEAVEV